MIPEHTSNFESANQDARLQELGIGWESRSHIFATAINDTAVTQLPLHIRGWPNHPLSFASPIGTFWWVLYKINVRNQYKAFGMLCNYTATSLIFAIVTAAK